jgi:hypothetical protein
MSKDLVDKNVFMGRPGREYRAICRGFGAMFPGVGHTNVYWI